MEEKRKFNRLYTNEDKKIFMSCAGGIEEEVQLLDLSANGMRVKLNRDLDSGIEIAAKIQVLSTTNIYYVKGKILRVEPRGDSFEASIQFDDIAAVPFE